MENIARGYYQFCLWVMRFFLINLLWIACTFLGLGVFGLMPATAAMFAVVRRWVYGDTDIPIYKTFWEKYKQSFIQTNLHGVVLFSVGYVLITEFRIAQSLGDGVAHQITLFAIIGALFLFGMVILYYFPIYVHFHLKNISYLKWPFIIGVIHPILTVVLMLLLIGFYFFIQSSIPILFFLFGGSVSAYLIMWGVSKTFSSFEERNITMTT